MDMQLETVNLSVLAHTLAEELKKSDPTRQVEFMIEKDITTVGDPGLLRIVLENLLGNAWKFTGNIQKARIEFGIKQVDGVSAFFINDNGAGFDMAHTDKLFGAFQRLHTIDEFPGHGIGLATVQRIIHRHGGRMTVESIYGEGSTSECVKSQNFAKLEAYFKI